MLQFARTLDRFMPRIGPALTTIVAVVIAVVAIWWVVSSLTSGKNAKVEAKLGRETSGAVIDTVEVADAVAENVNRSAEDIDAETKELANEILAAPAGRRNDAARRAVCGMRAYRDHPDCAGVRPADPEGPARADQAR